MDAKKAFQGKLLTSAEFVKIFRKYDEDGNGKIEAGELDNLLSDLLIATRKDDSDDSPPSPEEIQQLREEVLRDYDENFDGCLDMNELEQILPTEANFLEKFQKLNRVTSVQFMQIYMHYDKDRSGFLEDDELEGFIRELLTSGKQCLSVSPSLIEDFKRSIIDLYDQNNDKKIGLDELALLMPVEENFMKRFKVNNLTDEQVDQMFSHYDADNSGEIEGDEILALLKDIMDQYGWPSQQQIKGDNKPRNEMAEIKDIRDIMLACCDENKDGKISKKELRLFIQRM